MNACTERRGAAACGLSSRPPFSPEVDLTTPAFPLPHFDDLQRCRPHSCVAVSPGRQHPPTAGRLSAHRFPRPPKPAQLHPSARPQHQVPFPPLRARGCMAGAHVLAIYRYKEWYSSTFHEDAGRLPRRQRQSESQAVVLLLLTLLTVAIGVHNGLLFCVYCWLCFGSRLPCHVSSVADVSWSERGRGKRCGPLCRAECQRAIRD